MDSLVARSWLDSAVAARDEEALEAWLAAYGKAPQAVVSQGLVAFAKSYDAWCGDFCFGEFNWGDLK